MMPVERSCPWVHSAGIAVEEGFCNYMANGRPVKNGADLLLCAAEADCDINDSRQQMVIFRDPRPSCVSAYFWLKARRNSPRAEVPIDHFVSRMFPVICKWMTVRFHVFTVLMRGQSTFFWYEDAMDDPYTWHKLWLTSVGLTLPASFVRTVTDKALSADFNFYAKGVDEHPGGREAFSERRYQDEIHVDTLASMELVMRTWLQPQLLEKLGIQ